MAERRYEPRAGGTLIKRWTDPEDLVAADLPAKIAAYQEIVALSDDARTLIALGLVSAAGSLEDFDARLANQWEMYQDFLDYFDYDSEAMPGVRKIGAWYTPEALIAFCGEETGFEAAQSIDGNNTTVWRHDQDHVHAIDYRLRGHRKRLEKIRFRYNATAPDREQLSSVSIYFAEQQAGLDDAANIVWSGDPLWSGYEGSYVEVDLATKKRGRFLRIVCSSANANHYVQIRELECYVGVVDF